MPSMNAVCHHNNCFWRHPHQVPGPECHVPCQAMRRLLHKHRVCVNNDVESILGARVPILKFKDVATGAFPEPAPCAEGHAVTWRPYMRHCVSKALEPVLGT